MVGFKVSSEHPLSNAAVWTVLGAELEYDLLVRRRNAHPAFLLAELAHERPPECDVAQPQIRLMMVNGSSTPHRRPIKARRLQPASVGRSAGK